MFGIIKYIIIVVIILFVLSSFNIKIESVFKSSILKENTTYLWNITTGAIKYVKGLI